MIPEVHILLVHYPVLNKVKETVATAVTNLDIHDNARSARAFGVKSFHLVTPLDAQIELVSRIVAHWQDDGFGARRIPSRAEAMRLVCISRTLDEALSTIVGDRDVEPVLISTCAREMGRVGYRDMRARMESDPGRPYVILFGTGYGLTDEIIERSHVVLQPIGTPADWNHLSVRSAVAISLDRLLGCY